MSWTDAAVYFGPTIKAATGAYYSSATEEFRPPLTAAFSISGIGAASSESAGTVSAHLDWDLIEYTHLFDVGGGSSHRISSLWTLAFNLSNVSFGFRIGASGEWGQYKVGEGSGYHGIGEPDFGGTSKADYWALMFTAGPRIDLLPFSPDVPVSIFLEALGSIGGGKKDGSGAFFGSILAQLGLQVAFY